MGYHTHLSDVDVTYLRDVYRSYNLLYFVGAPFSVLWVCCFNYCHFVGRPNYTHRTERGTAQGAGRLVLTSTREAGIKQNKRMRKIERDRGRGRLWLLALSEKGRVNRGWLKAHRGIGEWGSYRWKEWVSSLGLSHIALP